MKPIPETQPGDLIAEVTRLMLDERRHAASNAIKQILVRQEQLTIKINSGENQLKKDREALQKGKDRIEKLRAGDWTVLADEQKQGDGKQTEAAE